MIENFSSTYHCLSGGSCRNCRSSRSWRTAHGAPDICPHGLRIRSLRRLKFWLLSSGLPRYSFKPGDVLARTLVRLRIDAPTCSQCARWRKWMNRQGWLRCLWHWKLILLRLVIAARELAYPGLPALMPSSTARRMRHHTLTLSDLKTLFQALYRAHKPARQPTAQPPATVGQPAPAKDGHQA